MNKAKGTARIVLNTFLGIMAAVWAFPLVFTAFNSFKGQAEYNLGNFWDLPKGNELFNNIQYLGKNAGLFSGMMNSLLYAAVGALAAVFIALLAAYALTHLEIKGRMFWFLFIYSGTIFPFQVYLIPIFKGYTMMGLYNTKLGMILFYMAICIPFAMFVLRNFLLGVSSEICEAAKIDGAGNWGILTHIMLPMASAPLSVVFMTQFSWCWNDLMFGLTFTKSPNMRPVMAALSLMATKNLPALLLACLVASVPTILMFLSLQKNIENGFVYVGK
jgi:multiple sugar transport system permease protein